MFLIETKRARVVIQDLQLVVTPTSPQWVTEEQARGSICLRNLQRSGAVWATSKQRGRMKPGRPKARLTRKIQKKPKPKQQQSGDSVTLTKAELGQLLQQAADQAARKVAQSQPAPSAAPLEGIEERLESVLRGFIAAAPAATPGAPAQVVQTAPAGPEEPMFIPKGIVGSNSADLGIQSEESEGGDLGEAAAALKRLRENK